METLFLEVSLNNVVTFDFFDMPLENNELNVSVGHINCFLKYHFYSQHLFHPVL